MTGYFTPTKQKNELAEKEMMIKIENTRKKIEDYTLWYSEMINRFNQEIEALDFTSSFGYEIIKRNLKKDQKNIDDVNFYDIAPISGIAFDNRSRRLIYYFSNPCTYENYVKSEDVNLFEYQVIPYHEIKKAVCNVDSSTISETTASKTGVITRSIVGGLIAGEAGAIIGGLSGSEVSQTSMTTTHNSCEIVIFTNNEEYPVIKLTVEKLQNFEPGSKISLEMVVDLTESVLTNQRKGNYFKVTTNETKEYGASNGTYTPCRTVKVFELNCGRNIFDEDFEKYQHEIKVLNKPFDNELHQKYFKRINDSVNMNKTIKCFQELVQKIEANVLVRDGVDKQIAPLTLIEQLEKLVNIKVDGFVSEEEFVLFKKKLLES